MKNKKITYILLPLVLLIWGIIIYKVLSVIEEEPANVNSFSTTIDTTSNKNVIPDTFKLYADYRDPFLNEAFSPRKKPERSLNQKRDRETIKKDEKEELLSRLDFKGTISNPESNTDIGVMIYDGKSYFVDVNKMVGPFQVIDFNKDSVCLRYKGRKLYVRAEDS